MKNPQKDKLLERRRGFGKARRWRKWNKYCCSAWDKPGPRIKTVPVPVEPDEPQMDEAAELYSEYRLIIEDGPNGSVSCHIQED